MPTDQKRKQPFTYEEFLEIYTKVPRLAVDLLIQTEKGTLFIIRETEPYKGQWHLPGGTVLFRESIKDAIIRLAKEETGLDLNESNIGKFEGYIEYLYQSKESKPLYAVSLVFGVRFEATKVNINEKIQIFKELPENIMPPVKSFLYTGQWNRT